MTHDDHQRERMRAWALFCASMMPRPAPYPERDADSMLAEFDKRFPAPSAAAPVEAGGDKTFWAMTETEYLSLRQKARLWDAVASGKVRLNYYTDGRFAAFYGSDTFTSRYPTAAETVEVAIAAGALK